MRFAEPSDTPRDATHLDLARWLVTEADVRGMADRIRAQKRVAAAFSMLADCDLDPIYAEVVRLRQQMPEPEPRPESDLDVIQGELRSNRQKLDRIDEILGTVATHTAPKPGPSVEELGRQVQHQGTMLQTALAEIHRLTERVEALEEKQG